MSSLVPDLTSGKMCLIITSCIQFTFIRVLCRWRSPLKPVQANRTRIGQCIIVWSFNACLLNKTALHIPHLTHFSCMSACLSMWSLYEVFDTKPFEQIHLYWGLIWCLLPICSWTPLLVEKVLPHWPKILFPALSFLILRFLGPWWFTKLWRWRLL